MTDTETLVAQWGKDRGIIAACEDHTPAQIQKLKEEYEELLVAHRLRDHVALMDAIGDMAVVLTMIAHINRTTLKDCYAAAYEQIKDRKGKMVNGQFIKESK